LAGELREGSDGVDKEVDGKKIKLKIVK